MQGCGASWKAHRRWEHVQKKSSGDIEYAPLIVQGAQQFLVEKNRHEQHTVSAGNPRGKYSEEHGEAISAGKKMKKKAHNEDLFETQGVFSGGFGDSFEASGGKKPAGAEKISFDALFGDLEGAMDAKPSVPASSGSKAPPKHKFGAKVFGKKPPQVDSLAELRATGPASVQKPARGGRGRGRGRGPVASKSWTSSFAAAPAAGPTSTG